MREEGEDPLSQLRPSFWSGLILEGRGEAIPWKKRLLPVLDRALGRDLHPKPVGEPPSRLPGGKSPELYSGT